MKSVFGLASLATVLSVCLFLSFKSIYVLNMTPYASELAAGFLGAVITVIVTAILLHAQSANDLRKEKSVGVFQAKLACYNEFLSFLNDVIRDDSVDDEEVRELEHWALRLSLIAGPELTECLVRFIDQSILFGKYRYSDLSVEEKGKWKLWYEQRFGEGEAEDLDFVSIGTVLLNMKVDLGEERLSSEEQAQSTSCAIDEMLGHSALSKFGDGSRDAVLPNAA